MAATKESVSSVAPEIDEHVVGLYNKEENTFHVLPIGKHTLCNRALSRNEVVLVTKDDKEDFLLEVSVKRNNRLYFVCVYGSCIVNGELVPSGGNPVKMKLGGSIVLGGSSFVFKERGVSTPRLKKKERRLPSLPQEDPLSTADDASLSTSTSHSSSFELGQQALIKSINKDIRRLQCHLSQPLHLTTPYAMVVASIVTYQVLLQPRAAMDRDLHKTLQDALLLVESCNGQMLLQFIHTYREALHRPATPTQKLPTNLPVINFLFASLREATSCKDLLKQMVSICSIVTQILVSFCDAPSNQQVMVECGVYRKLTDFMQFAGLKDSIPFLLHSWGVLGCIVRDSTPGTAMPLERVTLSVKLIKDQLPSCDQVTGKIMMFMDALGAKARECAKTHSESDLRVVRTYSIPDAASILEQLASLLSVLKTLPPEVTSDAKFSKTFSSLVTVLSPVSPVPRKPPRNRSSSPPKSPKIRRLPKVPSKSSSVGVTDTPSQEQNDMTSPLIANAIKVPFSPATTSSESGPLGAPDTERAHYKAQVSLQESSSNIHKGSSPTIRGTSPTTSGALPISSVTLSTDRGTASSSRGTFPTSTGALPTSEENPPTSSETPPTNGGTLPNSSGTSPISGITQHTSSGTPPTSSGTPPTSNGTLPTNRDTPPTTECLSSSLITKNNPLENGGTLPTHIETLPTAESEIQPRSNDVDPVKRLSLGKREGGPGVRGILAQQIPSLNKKELLGQEKGKYNLPPVRRDSPYYQTLTLKGSSSGLAELRRMREEDSSSDSEEHENGEQDNKDVDGTLEGEVNIGVQPGEDGRESAGSLRSPPNTTADNPDQSMSRGGSWGRVSADELFAFKDKKNALLSDEQQALEEIQAGHMDVMWTLQGRWQLIPNVCRLWAEDEGLRAATNTMQMCLSEQDEDIALFTNVLSVFKEIKTPWRLSVCAVLLPVLRRILVEQNDRRYLVPACEVVEMIVERFTDIITSCKNKTSIAKSRFSSSYDQQSKKICYTELHHMMTELSSKSSDDQLFQRLKDKLSPYVDPLL